MLISVLFPSFLISSPHATMSTAGPSQRRRRGSFDESQAQSQSQRQTQTQDGSRRKRPRGSLREELFDKPDLEEQARIVAGYRDMQMAADGKLRAAWSEADRQT